MSSNHAGRHRSERNDGRRWEQGSRVRRPDEVLQSLDLGEYLDELAEIRVEARGNLAGAGERSLKTLDRFLATVARGYGMYDERPSMSDSLRYLSRVGGTAAAIARQADRYRDTRNALAHNPDITLRPEAANRIIEGVESIVRMAAGVADEIAHRRVVCVGTGEAAVDARDRMLSHGYNQLVVVDDSGGVIDLLTERDLVAAEARSDLDGDGNAMTVADVIGLRDYRSACILPHDASIDAVVDALRDDRIGAVVVTATGQSGEHPQGIITRGDVLKLL